MIDKQGKVGEINLNETMPLFKVAKDSALTSSRLLLKQQMEDLRKQKSELLEKQMVLS